MARAGVGLTAANMLLLLATLALANQVVFSHGVARDDHNGPSVPHRWFNDFDARQEPRAAGDDGIPPKNMKLIPLSVKGNNGDRVNLAIFADGYTPSEKHKFLDDAQRLSDDIVGEGGAMAHVSDLVNVWAVWAASKTSGLGHDAPLPGNAFGLYREGATLRAVLPGYPKRIRAACTQWRNSKDACDQAVVLGNDELYGGLGGEFTITTSSRANGVVVARHELGHSLIEEGEEYDNAWVYEGANSDAVENLHNLKWKDFLTEPDRDPVIQDSHIAIRTYAWYNLNKTWTDTATSANTEAQPDAYNNSMIRLSLSSIAQPDWVKFTLNGKEIDLAPGFLPEMNNSLDRRWVEIFPQEPLPVGNSTLQISLTEKGRAAQEGKGGKMVTSAEIIEYGHTFIKQEGYVGAFPTVAENGNVTLRPTNEECVMRKVNYPGFCVVCKDALRKLLLGRIEKKKGASNSTSV